MPLQPRYSPTLGQLLAPRWHTARRATRLFAVAAGAGLAALAVAGVLSLLDARISYGGRVPFSFAYRELYRTTPQAGQYVRVARHTDGRLESSYAVAPLRLPPYGGTVTGELPLFAAGYASTLSRRLAGFRLQGEGVTRITPRMTGYQVLYSVLVDGRRLNGRDVLMLSPGGHAREGVAIEMLSAEPVSVAKPVASSGVLERPLKTFSFG